MKNYIRKDYFEPLKLAVYGDINLIQAVVGPRQVGKTTLALQLFKRFKGPKLYETADQPNTPVSEWIEKQWNKIRIKTGHNKKGLLILDEVQKIPNWSVAVKKLFDEDHRIGRDIRTIILGSSALLMQRGLTESLAGRFELHRHYQWSFKECSECFGLSLNEYFFYGGYPGAIALRKNEPRWARYMRDSLIETVLSKDILLLSPVSKPVLLRQTFGLAMDYPAQIVSYQKMVGSLQDAGNTTTIASYMQLLSRAFLLTALERYSGAKVRRRGSTPKILIFDNGLISAMSGKSFAEVLEDKTQWGRMLENAVGAQLYFLSQKAGGSLFYWRDRNNEVDYILKIGQVTMAIEVKTGKTRDAFTGLHSFKKKYKNTKTIVITQNKLSAPDIDVSFSIKDFFANPAVILDLKK